MTGQREITVSVEVELFARIAGREYPIATYTPHDGETQLDCPRFAELLREAADAVERADEEGGGGDGRQTGDSDDHRSGAAKAAT